MEKWIAIGKIALSILKVLPIWIIVAVQAANLVVNGIALSLGQITSSDKITNWAIKASAACVKAEAWAEGLKTGLLAWAM